MQYTLLSAFRTNYNTSKPPIILKSISFPARNEFYLVYMNSITKKPLILLDIGFGTQDRINIQESLSSSNAILFRKAIYMHLKKSNGFVKTKQTANSNH